MSGNGRSVPVEIQAGGSRVALSGQPARQARRAPLKGALFLASLIGVCIAVDYGVEALDFVAPEVGEVLVWAQRHHEIIARFGRFPHRNAALGRSSTLDEIEFLKQPGSSF